MPKEGDPLEESDLYWPLFLTGDDGVMRGNDWAQSFMRGVSIRYDEWRELLHSEDHGGAMLPIMYLAHEHDPNPELRSPPITTSAREQLLQHVIAGMVKIYQYFESRRHLAEPFRAQTPLRRAGVKTGRNEPCTCGSGRKYKHCCATGALSLH
jgi:uncharacterized protein